MKFGLKQISDTQYEGKRLFFVDSIKVVQNQDDGFYYISGYANTKGQPDSYGDIPYNLNGEPVYDLSRFEKNPVMLVDHCVSVGHIMGQFVELREDQIGLYFRAKLIDINEAYTEIVQHAISCYRNGFAKALSIGGVWEFNDPNNKSHLTKAHIFEISGVAIGADENALVTEKTKPMDEAPANTNPRGVLESRLLKAKADFILRSGKNVRINTVC